ncbi:MAG: V-type ATP synthase subunit D [Candidatus Aenigmarchaeota archaeon]|nr:V-type ATP synthase subunit D [Candidatus Aenigmarchaeota archaeon]
MAQDVKPTRSELMKLKKSIKLAESGYNLLKKKRDGLILEFFDTLKKAKSVRSELTAEYVKADRCVNVAESIDGALSVQSYAMALKECPRIEVTSKNVMGVVVPKISATNVVKHMHERGYGLIGSSSRIDEAAYAYEHVVDKVVLAAEVETTILKLLDEIEKTKRRVNALEFSVIPRMKDQAAFIRLRLEEMERENVFRLKRMKK